MPTILLATANQDKVKELSSHFADMDISIISIDRLNSFPHVVEDQPTLKGNATKKAITFSKATGYPSLADDTGLEVDILHGEPGVFSARYAGENASYSDNVDKLLAALANIPFSQRSARFRTVMAFAFNGTIETVEGVCEGFILPIRRGQGGFGYDPVFFVPEYNKTFAEMSLAEKNRISHRGIAVRKMKEIVRSYLGA
ncbi:RdgB/HAM1 family non-canonical purine NTP pyrophosphatase [candidate division KSB1 bacterium]|nr:RdgB/HAM1 family non-canonical purine NTP pyrophosphatase [candidate division KSB1 bacterium]